MANPEHVKIVGKGASEIAKWRTAHPEETFDLVECDLHRADLRKADLSGADLHFINLRHADLRGANLSHATLHDAYLSGADLDHANMSNLDLSHAELSHTNLSRAKLFRAGLSEAKLKSANLDAADLCHARLNCADLSGANLSRAFLLETNLSHADLGGVELTGSIIGFTVFANVDLSRVWGLELVEHWNPSSIGVDTLIRSKGKIPKSFLKGCGVPEVWIEYLPTLIGAMEPIQFHSCFLSYSSQDDGFARRLHGRLEQEKLRVWFAPEDMKGGKRFARQIDEAIRVYDRLLLVLSEHSMGSEWVRREIKKARKKEKETGREVLFPIRLVDVARIKAWECLDSDSGEDLAEKVREYHIPDFLKWKEEDEFEKGFATLMRDLRREDEKKPKQDAR